MKTTVAILIWISGMALSCSVLVVSLVRLRDAPRSDKLKLEPRTVWLKPEGKWPVAVIYDAADIERLASGAKDLRDQNDHLSK